MEKKGHLRRIVKEIEEGCRERPDASEDRIGMTVLAEEIAEIRAELDEMKPQLSQASAMTTPMA